MRRPTILVTRPAPDGALTAKALAKATGLNVVESPLLEIRTLGPLPDMAGIRELIFTSRNGVRAYADLQGPALPAICVGEATAEAAREIGLDARALGGESDALIEAVRDAAPAGPLLHLRGEVARGEVAARLTKAGIETREAVIYQQSLLNLTAEARALLDARKPVIVPLYSPRTAARLAEIADNPRAPLHLIAMSGAVAKAASALHAENRTIAEAPDAGAMIRAILATLRRVERMDS